MDTLNLRLQHVTISQRVYDAMVDLMLSHRYDPGQRLFIEQIAKQLGVSETPVKQALVRLSAEGLVEFVPGKGPFLAKLGTQQIVDLANARMMCELFAVAEGKERVTDEWLARLQTVQDELEAIASESQAGEAHAYRRYILKDKEFHCLIVSLSGNAIVEAWYASLNDHLRIDTGAPLAHWRVSPQTVEKHRALIRALRARDWTQVEATIRANIADVIARYVGVLADSR